MSNKNTNPQLITIVAFIILAVLSRLLPHPPNVTPIVAVGLFGAAHFSKKYLAFLVPFIALFISDLVLCSVVYKMDLVMYFQSSIAVYLSFAAVIGMGVLFLKKYSRQNVFFGTILASLLFFVLSNVGVWLSGMMYPMNFAGLLACFTAALPFFLNSILGNLFFTFVLFGAYEMVNHRFLVPNLD